MPEKRQIKCLGSEVDLVTLDEVQKILIDWIQADDAVCRQMIVTGFHGLFRAYKDPYYREVARDGDLWVPDGIAPVLLARLNGLKGVDRTPGMDIINMYMKLADERKYSSFFYGETRHVLDKMKQNIEVNYPGHRIAGMYSPPFKQMSDSEHQEVIDRINDSGADVVWVGLGMPKQDIWGYENKSHLKAKAVIGVGAAFGFLAGQIERCPDWIGKHGFEWAYRFAKEPDKLWQRDFIEGPQFLWHVLMERTGLRKYE